MLKMIDNEKTVLHKSNGFIDIACIFSGFVL